MEERLLKLARLLAAAIVAGLQACATVPPPAGEPGAIPPPRDASGPLPVFTPAPAPVPSGTAAAPPAPPDSPPLDASRLPPFDGARQVVQAPSPVATIDRTVQPDDLWERIRRGFAMPDLDGALVQDKVAFYAARPDYLQRMFDRSRRYLYHIVAEIEKRGLPTELALLPMVESAFNPMAYSRAHASGLWQFIPGTGKRYDLAQNWWYDGRRDIVDSTTAALEYLSNIYDMHGDWHLALASYNWGENAVARAIARNRAAGLPTDYSSLTMPAETRHYVPKLQALKNIIRDPRPFGVALGPIPNQPYFAMVDGKRDIDVQLAAKLAEMPVEEFIALNPGFSRPVIRAAMAPRIVLPADRVEVFHDNLAKYDKGSLVSWQTYHPKKGDTLEAIAKRHGLTVAQLREVNGITARTRGLPNLLVVPVNGASVPNRRLPIMYAPPIPVQTAAPRRVVHTVQKGDTLETIARRYGVTAQDVRRLNPSTRLLAGQKLTIETRAPAARPRSTLKPGSRAAPKGNPSKKVASKPKR